MWRGKVNRLAGKRWSGEVDRWREGSGDVGMWRGGVNKLTGTRWSGEFNPWRGGVETSGEISG